MGRIETIGNAKLYLGDCRKLLPMLGTFDALVTDPPYGFKAAAKKWYAGKNRGKTRQNNYGPVDWDNTQIDGELISLCRSVATWQIIFGGNYYELPPARCWLIWDKQNGESDFSDCELAWTNLDKPVRRIYWAWHGMIRKGSDVREHPTQKPVGVMAWAIDHLPKNKSIYDPFMGSGSTGVAAIRRGKSFVGVEMNERYFEIACRRIAEANKQADFLVELSK